MKILPERNPWQQSFWNIVSEIRKNNTFVTPDFDNPMFPEHLLTNQPRITAKAVNYNDNLSHNAWRQLSKHHFSAFNSSFKTA